MKLHHIGIAAENMEDMISYVQNMFPVKEFSDRVFDEKQNGELCMLTLEDSSRIELISGPVVAGRIKKRQFLYHTCYETEKLEETIEAFLKKGAVLISEPKEAVLFQMRRVAFLMTDLGIVELLEEHSGNSNDKMGE